MLLCKWEKLPEKLRVPEVRKYYDILMKKSCNLIIKRIFDVTVSLFLLLFLSPAFLVLALAIKIDSKGPILYRQIRITQYGKKFKIHKFRSMYDGAEMKGLLVTTHEDNRITKIGKVIRRWRLDELPQLIDVFLGTMTFVGVRPEVPKYVEVYSREMMATLLLPAGVTSLTSIYYKDEANILINTDDINRTYIERILPEKMKWNLKGVEQFSFWGDIKIMFMTFFAMCGKDYHAEDINGL